ncbi:MAG: dihydrofolate reductase family protein [Elusimicrobia bacterium]|nr:dihydrofolate reductase family protein [Elusimicrobiota bacterium]
MGAETVRRDNPFLTSHGLGPDPVRVVLSGTLDLPVRSHVFEPTAPTWILTKTGTSPVRTRALEKAGALVVRVPGRGQEADPHQVLLALGRRGITHLLVEGGGRVAACFLSAGLVDEVYLFVAPSFLGGKEAPTAMEGRGESRPSHAPRLKRAEIHRIGDDWLIHGFLL